MLPDGHLHDGGAGIQITLNGKEICNSRAVYGGDGFEGKSEDGKPWYTINHMETCAKDIAVKAGDKIAMQANYDTEKHPG
jgi:hypothetical protein